jgi:hypothetical protein
MVPPWLVLMLVIMPLTAAGIFAKDLLEGQWATIGRYLAVALTYAAVLGLAHVRLLALQRAQTAHSEWDAAFGTAIHDDNATCPTRRHSPYSRSDGSSTPRRHLPRSWRMLNARAAEPLPRCPMGR